MIALRLFVPRAVRIDTDLRPKVDRIRIGLYVKTMVRPIYNDRTHVTVNRRLQLHTILTVAFSFRLVLSVRFVTKRYILQQNFGRPLDTPTLPFVQNC